MVGFLVLHYSRVFTGIALTKGKTYELTGTLSVEFNSLTVHVITATLASNEVIIFPAEFLCLKADSSILPAIGYLRRS